MQHPGKSLIDTSQALCREGGSLGTRGFWREGHTSKGGPDAPGGKKKKRNPKKHTPTQKTKKKNKEKTKPTRKQKKKTKKKKSWDVYRGRRRLKEPMNRAPRRGGKKNENNFSALRVPVMGTEIAIHLLQGQKISWNLGGDRESERGGLRRIRPCAHFRQKRTITDGKKGEYAGEKTSSTVLGGLGREGGINSTNT